LFKLAVGAALAAKVKAGAKAMVAAVAPVETSTPRRVMERKFSVIWRPAILSIQVSGDVVLV
jgi:hypothetical protein